MGQATSVYPWQGDLRADTRGRYFWTFWCNCTPGISFGPIYYLDDVKFQYDKFILVSSNDHKRPRQKAQQSKYSSSQKKMLDNGLKKAWKLRK